MVERRELVNTTLPLLIKAHEHKYHGFFQGISAGLEIDSCDGVGRSEECPWIRIFPPTMAPTPKNGFYVVIRFAADGSSLFVSIGCGSTHRKGRSWHTVSEEKLAIRTTWARNILTERFGSLAPFHDDVDLGLNAVRPRLYEKSTVVAKRISAEEIDEEGFINLISLAVKFLAEVCLSYRVGRHLDAGDAAQIEIESILLPKPKANRRKSFGLIRAERHAVHLRALAVALEWLEDKGYTVRESCSSSAYDFEARKNGEVIKVEVKGSTSDGFDSVVLTRDSVEFHRAHKGESALITVSSIRLDTSVSPPRAARGILEAFIAPDIDSWSLEHLAYKATLPPNRASRAIG